MKPVRVAFLSSYTGIGGGEAILLDLLRQVDRSRIEPVLLCPRDGQLPAEAAKLGVAVRIVPWRGARTLFVPALAGLSPGVRRVRAALREIAPAVIHTDFHSLPAAASAGGALRRPQLFACWGWWFRPRPWQRAFLRRAELTTVAGSEAIRTGYLGAPPFMDPARVEVVLPGVDPGRYAPRPEQRETTRLALGLPVDAPLVTLLARFQRVKGHDLFLDLARLLAGRMPEARFAIAGENVFGGGSDGEFKREVTGRVASDSLLRGRVTILGWVERADLLLSASDVVVCPSRFESFGVAAVEAMACAVPVVSTDRGGPSETIVDGETGFLVPPERPDLLAERVETLLRDAPLRRRMGEAGRARVLNRFTAQRYAARMTSILEGLATSRAVTTR